MLRQLLTYGKNYASVEHSERTSFTVLQLQQKRKELTILNKETVKSFENVAVLLKGQKHIFLVLNDEQVLFKRIAISKRDNAIILRTAFPNITISNFYYDIFTTGNEAFVAIARKDVINEIIVKYQQIKVSVIDFSLGNLIVKNLQNFIQEPVLFSSNSKISFDSGLLKNIEKNSVTQKTYLINGLHITNNEVLGLGGIISYYTKNKVSSIQKELYDRYFQKYFFNLGVKVALGCLLLILITNFFVFSGYRNQVEDLTGELEIGKTYKNQLNNLQEEVFQKKQLLESLNSVSNSKISLFYDELGMSTPKTTILSQIHYQPLAGIQKKDKPLIFDNDVIVVKGISKVNEDFSQWISLLEKKGWVKNVAIIAYGKGTKRTITSEFEFIITLND